MVAASSSKGLLWVSAHNSLGDPGYSSASRATVSRARPLGVRGRDMKSTLGTVVVVHHVEVKREMDKGDVAAVKELLSLAAAHDGHAPLGEHQWLDLVQGGREGFAGLVAWEPGHDHPVGYAQLTKGPSSWALEYVVSPHHREPGTTIGADLIDGALDIVRNEGGGHVHLWVFKPTDDQDRTAEADGLHRGRALLQLRRPLPVDES